MKSVKYPWIIWLLLGALTIGALLLRVWTIRQSLPYVDHPDEPNPINYVVEMLRSGDPNQQFFQKPSLFVYLLLSVLTAHYRWGQMAGVYGEIGQMVITTYTVTTIPGFFLAARWVSAIFGALAVLAAYALGRRGWGGHLAGLAGAAYVAVLPYHLRSSQFATTDVTASVLACLSLGAAMLAMHTGRWRAYLVAGAFAGLAASAKYNAGAVAGAIVAAAVVRLFEVSRQKAEGRSDPQPITLALGYSPWPDRLKELLKLGAAGLAAIGGFVAGTPYALLSWGQVSGGVLRQWGNYDGNNGHYRGAWNVAGYAEFFLYEGLGWAGCAAVLIGVGLLAWRRPKVLLVWLGFALPSLLVHLSRPTHFMQNMIPLLLACALPIGVAVAELSALLSRRLSRGLRQAQAAGLGPVEGHASGLRMVFAGLLLAAVALPLLALSLEYVGRQAGGDGRVQLIDWVERSVPPGVRIAAELKAVPGPTEARWTDVPRLDVHDLAWYRAQGYAYLVGSSKRWEDLEPPESYAPLIGTGPLITFGPRRREEMLGPYLIVLPTGLSAEDVPLPLAGEVRFAGARLLGVAMGDPSAEGAPPMLVPTAEFQAGGVLGLRSFWQVEQPFDHDYLIFVHVIDANGGRPTQRDAAPWQGRFPTTTWRPGTLVVDTNDVYLPPGLPPGEYRVIMGLYRPTDGSRPPATQDGTPLPDSQVEVARFRVGP